MRTPEEIAAEIEALSGLMNDSRFRGPDLPRMRCGGSHGHVPLPGQVMPCALQSEVQPANRSRLVGKESDDAGVAWNLFRDVTDVENVGVARGLDRRHRIAIGGVCRQNLWALRVQNAEGQRPVYCFPSTYPHTFERTLARRRSASERNSAGRCWLLSLR
jgi:hypothetical protein